MSRYPIFIAFHILELCQITLRYEENSQVCYSSVMNTLENLNFHKTLLEAPGNFCLWLSKLKRKLTVEFYNVSP